MPPIVVSTKFYMVNIFRKGLFFVALLKGEVRRAPSCALATSKGGG